MARTLVVTNDFPTRQGGIEAFVLALCQRLESAVPGSVVVYTATMPGGPEYDAGLTFPVIRDRTSTLLPTPAVSRRVHAVLRAEDCDRVMFGAAATLGLLAADLRKAGAKRLVGITHGHETLWSRVPLGRRMMRRIGRTTDTLTYLGDYTRSQIVKALAPADAARMVRLTPGVDTETFRPDPAAGRSVRERLGIDPDAPVVVCAGRLTPRKGQDTLVKAWPHVVRDRPDARLLLVGGGPNRSTLDRLVTEYGVADKVVFTGPVPWAEIPPYFAAGDVFASPCRSRFGGLEPEALGIVFLEASASGMPVIVGDSGGAPDTVLHGETGFVVDPYNPVAVASKVTELLDDPDRARAMGEHGRAWVTTEWTWERSVDTLRDLLDL